MTTAEKSERRQVVQGTSWTLLGYGASQFLRLGSNLVMAHLLFPEAFGIMALVNVFMQGVQMLSDIGVGPSIIHNPRGEDERFLNTAWTLQIIRGCILAAITFLLAWPVAEFYSAGQAQAVILIYILPVVALTMLIDGFTSISVFLLNRRMQLRKVVLLELFPQIVAVIVMIGFALFWPSVWALVAGWVIRSIVRLIYSHMLIKGRRDHLAWDKDAVKSLVSFGAWILASTAVTFFAMNLDRLVLGKLITLAELGIYSIAMSFARLGIHITTRLGNSVVFPLLTKRQQRPQEAMEFCLKGRRLILMAGGLACSSFAILGPLFFEMLYDPRYHAAGALTRWLAIYVWAWILVATVDRVPLAMGQPKVLFIANVLETSTLILAIAAYFYGGLAGFILGMTAAKIVALLYITTQLPAAKMQSLIQGLLYTLAYAAFACISLSTLNRIAAADISMRCLISASFILLLILPVVIIALPYIRRKTESCL
ncbi:MAG: oligosaccharide flippase family protein [Lentisphaeria bacterium]|nr:oligosaccharide flippase family protein [Lentisphaeria bacterium]NQZ70438.1 oligosaccharide flippase family protein [Lentisphaeria bacterium]